MEQFYDMDERTPEQVNATLKARAELPPLATRIANDDPSLVRLEITGTSLSTWEDSERDDLVSVIRDCQNTGIKTVHISAAGLDDLFTEDQLRDLLNGIFSMANLQEFFIFRGDNDILSLQLLAESISKAKNLKVLMMWGYRTFDPSFCLAVQRLENLERNTLTLPHGMGWSELDVYCMGLAQHPRLQCLSLRCSGRCEDAILSPEALAVLLQSQSIESLYLDSCGLTDDHTDVIAAELKVNNTIQLLDIKSNCFSDDALYSIASMLPHNTVLKSLDLSGVEITEEGGYKLARSMEKNRTLFYLELEGGAERYRDEFCVPEGSENTDWYKALDFRLRLNRSGYGKDATRETFVTSLNSVSDHLGCLFHILSHLPQHIRGTA